jgi:2'-5' RNA ligase/GNAT superfamily N-acetyltransferase
MARQRLGVALLVPAPVATEMDGLRRALGDDTLDRIPPHITLIPPVNVNDADMSDALALLRETAAATRPLRLELGPPTTFHPVTPVVYLAVGGDLEALHDLRDRVFHPPLSRPLSHSFVPHATLADEIDPTRIPPALAALAGYRVDVTIDRVHVLREGRGRVWRPVADAAFAPPRVIGRGGLPVEISESQLVDPLARLLLPGTAAPSSDTPGAWALTARREGCVVGLAHGATVGDRVEVEALVVAPPHRRQGVGGHLRAALEDLAARRDATLVMPAPLD